MRHFWLKVEDRSGKMVDVAVGLTPESPPRTKNSYSPDLQEKTCLGLICRCGCGRMYRMKRAWLIRPKPAQIEEM